MFVLITTGITPRLQLCTNMPKILCCLLWIIISATAYGQTYSTYDLFTKNNKSEFAQQLVDRYDERYAVASIGKDGAFSDQLPNFISRVLYVDGIQQKRISDFLSKISAVDLIVIRETTDINQLPVDLFQSLPNLKFLVIEFQSDKVSITTEQLQRKFKEQDIADRIILLKPINTAFKRISTDN